VSAASSWRCRTTSAYGPWPPPQPIRTTHCCTTST
jgi:hypothetical protein